MRILLVDDEPINLELMVELLQDEGHQLLLARDGKQALALCIEQTPDLVLLDLAMPKMDGFAVLQELRCKEATRLLPIVVVTAHAARAMRLRAIEMGADDFVTKPFDNLELRTRVKALLRYKTYLDELERSEGVLLSLGRIIEARDPNTLNHCERIANMARVLGARLGLSEREARALHLGAFLHDIGKVGIPDAVLLKPGPLDQAEQATMRMHPVIGEQMLRSLASMRDVLPLIRHHHERLDGSGYPDHISGDKIPAIVRVLSVCDVFDALTERRPYRNALSIDVALEILHKEVKLGYWDRTIVTALEDQLRANEKIGAIEE